MHKVLLSVLLSAVLIAAGSSAAFALQSGGVEIGDLETGSVVGQPFKKLDVDIELNAMEIGGKKVWYPPVSILSLVASATGGRAGRPVLLKVTNNMDKEHGFSLSADSAMAGPTSMDINLVLAPGETKYIGIPISDLTYVTSNNLLNYKCQLHSAHLGGQLLVMTK
ncbi:MAG TPA: hypothetical protein PKK23_03970 [Nitrospirales bacterium]|nr:hypothetical protein [Nitrospiraceae bacterium]HNP28175.1 hypothetical protein [Nitrospirales bacterium]